MKQTIYLIAVLGLILLVFAIGTFALSFLFGYYWLSRQSLLEEILLAKVGLGILCVVSAMIVRFCALSSKLRFLISSLCIAFFVGALTPGIVHARSAFYLSGMATRLRTIEDVVSISLPPDSVGKDIPKKLSALNQKEFAFWKTSSNQVRLVWGTRLTGAWGIEISNTPLTGRDRLKAGQSLYVFIENAF